MRPFCIADVNRKILDQHQEIRAQIDALRRNAAHGDVPAAAHVLRSLVLRFAAYFDAHLAFEERELAPRIRELDAWGEVREAALRDEHRDQRGQLEEICALATAPEGGDALRLAGAIYELTDSLLEDMRKEESTLVELARIEKFGHVDQMTG